MQKTMIIALLSCCIFVLAVVFADTHSTFAHEIEMSVYETTAKQASDAQSAGDQAAQKAMEGFLRHVREHLENLSGVETEQVKFRNTLRVNDGVYRHNDTYSIIVNRSDNINLKAGEIIYFHAEYRTASSGSLRDIGVFEQLMAEVEQASDEVACVKDDGTHGNYICAGESFVKIESGEGLPPIKIPAIVVVGFNNEFEEVSFTRIDCPSISDFGQTVTDPKLGQFTRTSADMVDSNDEESLVNYLKTVEAHVSGEIQAQLQPLLELDPVILRKVLEGVGSPEETDQVLKVRTQVTVGITQRLSELQHCWRQEPWRSGSIYFYLITYGPNDEGIVDGTIQFGVFNGITAEFHDRSFRLYDGCLNVGRAVFDEVTKDDDTPDEGFLRYYWTNPDLGGTDGVNENGNPIEGLSPGTSVKLGYFRQTDFFPLGLSSPKEYVLGSGIYPEGETYYVPESGECEAPPETLPESSHAYLDQFPSPPEDDDGGCAIASGTGNNFKIAAFNLFLITAVLLLAVSRKTRLGGKFWI